MHKPLIPDLIIKNADIITMDPAAPRAGIVVVRNGKVLSAGGNGELKKYRCDNSNVIDCNGRTVMPGFIDSHLHFFSFAESLTTLNLGPRDNVRSISDIQTRIRKLAAGQSPGTWIRCGGYDEFALEEKRHPTRGDLDAASSTHPIKLAHRTGHAHVLNSIALNLAGITRETPDPEGGLIDRDVTTGDPTGLLFGMGGFLSKRVPSIDSRQLETGVIQANRELLSMGITSFQDASYRNDIARLNTLLHWKAEGKVVSGVSLLLGVKNFKELKKNGSIPKIKEVYPDIKGVKIILDEATGRLNPDRRELFEMVAGIHQSGLQVAVHAIEETTVEAACDAIEYAQDKYPRVDPRHRIEHCSVCPPSLAKRIASLGIMVVTQPPFIYYNGSRYIETVPAAMFKYLYPVNTLIKQGVIVAASSDCPVVPANPLVGIYSAVSRMSETGEPVLEKEGVDLMTALRMYTDYAARATFEEDVKGAIMPGRAADFVVLSADPAKVPVAAIKDIKVEMTIINGEIVWNRKESTDYSSFDK